MFVTEHFLSGLVKDSGKHHDSTDDRTWYPQACEFLTPERHIHSSWEKILIERKMQYITDRTERFDDYFQCRKAKLQTKPY
jgi:putative transposase